MMVAVVGLIGAGLWFLYRMHRLEKKEGELTTEIHGLRDEVKTLTTHLTYDPLTGLLRRGPGLERLESELSRCRRHGHPLVLVMGDLDDFGQWNKRLSVQAGDAVLRAVGGLILAPGGIRKEDAGVRHGGEEMYFVLPETNLQQGVAAAEKIRALLDTEVEWHGHRMKISMSLGLVMTDGSMTAEQLIFAADQAMRAAKKDGKNRVRVSLNGGTLVAPEAVADPA
jgi:diguanylate cyclase (GGDEF)-like protein